MGEQSAVPSAPAARGATKRRREQLMSRVHAGEGSIDELADYFSVSASTIRRDLTALERGGQVLRTYGGAAAPGHIREPSLRAKQSTHPDEKDAIGRYAATLVSAGDVVLLDAGTTVGRLAWHLRQREGVTVVTNGLSALIALVDAPGIDVIVLGGHLRRPNDAFLGVEVAEAIRHFRPDLVFLGTDGLDPTRGLNCPSFEQARLKELMAEAGRRGYVLADQSKLTSDPYPYWASQPRGTALVTDRAAPRQRRAFEAEGWRVETPA